MCLFFNVNCLKVKEMVRHPTPNLTTDWIDSIYQLVWRVKLHFSSRFFFLPEPKIILKGRRRLKTKNTQKFLKLAEGKNRNYKQKYCEMSACKEKTMV